MSAIPIVTIGDLVFDGNPPDPTRPAAQFVIEEDGLDGWDGNGVAWSVDNQPLAYTGRPGTFDVSGSAGARVITITGRCIAGNSRRLRAAGRYLTSFMADGRRRRLTVEQDGEILWADVRLTGTPTFTVDGDDPLAADFSVQFRAARPQRYGATRTYVAGDNVRHYGEFTAYPRITVHGSMAGGYTINGPGGAKYTVAANPSGHTHLIDMSNGRLYIDGVFTPTQITRADTWGIPVGEVVVFTLTPAAGTGTLSIEVTDTSI